MFNKSAKNKSSDLVEWQAVQTLMASCIYGGKVDNEFDQQLITTFVRKFFNAASVSAGSDLTLVKSRAKHDDKIAKADIERDDNVVLKSEIAASKEAYVEWIENHLGVNQKPTWLGLPNNAEHILLKNLGIHIFLSLFLSLLKINKFLLSLLSKQIDKLTYKPIKC